MKNQDIISLTIIPNPDLKQMVNDVVKIYSSDLNAGTEISGVQSSEVAVLSKALIAVANQAWRIASAIIDPDTQESKREISSQEIKKVGNALESIREVLGGISIKIIDRLGEPFNAGLPDQVVTEEQREGLTREQIIRTIRPTIMWNQTMVQRGEIDIAVPPIKK